MKWFEVKVKYEKILETGTQKMVTDTYLMDALTFAEAESRTIKEVEPFISGEFEVEAAKRCSIAEVRRAPDSDKWYRCKVIFIALDEKSGVEKKAAQIMMVQATDFEAAVANLNKLMKDTVGDWYMHTITETNIIDVFQYEPEQAD